MVEKPKDRWDKAGVLFKGLGGILIPITAIFLGFFTQNVLQGRQRAEANIRLYSQLMSQREQAESSLRKDMFNSIIGSFLETELTGRSLDEDILHLELLAYNFHESLNIDPLFKHVKEKIKQWADTCSAPPEAGTKHLKRLDRIANVVSYKQLMILEAVGKVIPACIDYSEIAEQGTQEETLESASDIGAGEDVSPDAAYANEGYAELPLINEFIELNGILRHFSITATSMDVQKKEIGIDIEVAEFEVSGNDTSMIGDYITASFHLDYYDFPMIDNTRLTHDQRCSVSLSAFEDSTALITLVYFPGEYASLREKPYWDDLIAKLLSKPE